MVVTIFLGDKAEAAMREVAEARAVAGKGLEGDRYFNAEGTFSKKKTPDRQITLIEEEAIAAVARDYKLALDAKETRRNVVTRGVALNHLVGREFTVGETRLRGIKLCDPCSHLEKLTREGIKGALANRGGLRCEILTGGTIHKGDRIDVAPETGTTKIAAVRD